jgi:hypothetical protein
MNNRRCSDCTFAEAWGEVYRCHYNPPVQIRDVRNDVLERFPLVAPDDWCGFFAKGYAPEPTPNDLVPIHEDFA